MASQGKLISVNLDQLVLDLKNNRHEPKKRPEDAIRYHLQSERVLNLALSIAKENSNPLDLLALVEKKGTGTRKNYVAVEGNRRTCAYMLLLDPERVPSGLPDRQKIIQKLEKATAIADLSSPRNAILFKSKKEAKFWIDLQHINDNDGSARRRWNADQRERASGGGRNKKAMAILDLAEALELVDRSKRDKVLTTVQRYVGNPALRDKFGISFSATNEILVSRSPNDFRAILERFVSDTMSGNISSRSTAKDVADYADAVQNELSLGEDRYQETLANELLQSSTPSNNSDDNPDSDQSEQGDNSENGKTTYQSPPLRTKIGVNGILETKFHEIGSQKLLSLYKSCCNASLKKDTPLATVGMWSILETLAAAHNGSEKKFIDYFSNDRLGQLGFPKGTQRKDIRKSIEQISHHGNSTKHSMVAALFDGQQLANDVDILVPFMIKVCEDILSAGS